MKADRVFKTSYRIARYGRVYNVAPGDSVMVIRIMDTICIVELKNKVRLTVATEWVKKCTEERQSAYNAL